MSDETILLSIIVVLSLGFVTTSYLLFDTQRKYRELLVELYDIVNRK